ncbi:helix-turn-helix domain-containing protein [Dolichospermum sp. LEGE 00246]|uniref:helix-turn-helix domain-containing protein n=1 Tax=Dolichospermum sp. LEGE 00246 TaxID=1828605 RepID=UPI00187E513B|nr:helix-turn-helix transcriptional regulator [Dolichospermum sp. LEGE 00246]MBE9258983.1 helix-turn-helix transcriptional regulator [Dolichospermum sp. LEGE 00246]MDK2410295.1 helix-turn-helix transcriptional regulator [Aphanizomenon sp. 202]MDK2461148.1 helix-turn-helix transcriptional regulator [Aphanizomenon sp. PH219]
MEKTLVTAVASTVKHFRKINSMSQEELADNAGLDRTYISGVERGVRNITLDSLEQIINALGIDILTFFTKLFEYLGDIKSEI